MIEDVQCSVDDVDADVNKSGIFWVFWLWRVCDMGGFQFSRTAAWVPISAERRTWASKPSDPIGWTPLKPDGMAIGWKDLTRLCRQSNFTCMVTPSPLDEKRRDHGR